MCVEIAEFHSNLLNSSKNLTFAFGLEGRFHELRVVADSKRQLHISEPHSFAFLIIFLLISWKETMETTRPLTA